MTVAASLVPRWLVLLRRRQTAEGVTPVAVSRTASTSQHVLGALRDGRPGLDAGDLRVVPTQGLGLTRVCRA